MASGGRLRGWNGGCEDGKDGKMEEQGGQAWEGRYGKCGLFGGDEGALL